MKRAAFLLVVVLLLFACNGTQIIVVSNQTAKDISYVLWAKSMEQYIIKAHEQNEHIVDLYFSHQIYSYEAAVLPQSVYFENTENTYVFKDTPPISVSIFNTLPKDVILRADGYLSTDPVTVNANDEVTSLSICTKTPSFTAETIDKYPVQVDVRFINNNYMLSLR
jgi:hypothetical protein